MKREAANRYAIDLCSGCGGLAVAARELGYEHRVLVDNNARCVQTLRSNGFGNAIKSDLADMNWQQYEDVELLTAGLPCQPFSIGGKDTGASDSRNLWQEAIRALRELKPDMFMFEMVAGFLREKFKEFREQLTDQLRALGYRVQLVVTNASAAGLPQSRKRCLFLGHHGEGEIDPPRICPRVNLRHALYDLGEPDGVNRHDEMGPAKAYVGHGPSKPEGLAHTIRAGIGRGPGGGNNTLLLPDGRIRYFTVRELARIQGFSDNHQFDPVWSHAVKELGNAAPPPLMRMWLEKLLEKRSVETPLEPPSPALQPNLPDASTTAATTGDGADCEHDDDEKEDEERKQLRLKIDAVNGELERKTRTIQLLQAQASVLQRDYSRLVAMLRSKGREAISELANRISNDADWIEDGLGPEARDAMVAAVEKVPVMESGFLAVLKTSGYLNQTDDQVNAAGASVAKTARRAIELAKVVKDLDRSRKLRRVLMQEGSQSERQLAYLDLLDSSPADEPGDVGEPRVWDVTAGKESTPEAIPCGRKVYFRVPRACLEDQSDPRDQSTDTTQETEPAAFFRNSIANVEEEGGFKYQSLKAVLPLEDSGGNRVAIESIVDSGAAWCAIRLSVLREQLPETFRRMKASRMKFHDATGRVMSLRGRVQLRILIGERRVSAMVYVFEHLGAPFLLGANALMGNGCVIDCNRGRLYVADDPDGGVEVESGVCVSCESAAHDHRFQPAWQKCTDCPKGGGEHVNIICDRDNKVIKLVRAESDCTVATIGCQGYEGDSEATEGRTACLTLDRDVTILPFQLVHLDPKLEGVNRDSLAPIELTLTPSAMASGLEFTGTSFVHNPTSKRCPFTARNPTDKVIVLRTDTKLARQVQHAEEDTVLVAAVLDEGQAPKDADPPPDVDNGGIEFLRKLGFSLDKACDPSKRRDDGSYEDLSEDKKRILYEIALRWYQVWSTDAKVPKVSYLVVIDIPTGTAAPIAQAPYPIPAKLRNAAMEEINKLLKAGLIEPSISDWASPALVRVKKDSTADSIKIKFAIDYRRCNAVTESDAGGLGTQADILYGVGGKFKYLGLCDAAGGFYQFLLSPKSRHKSAFILPASMGGTLFQWRVAPYGLTRNPAGYSRGMQWVPKGLHDLTGLGEDGSDKAGATSWLDDICMRATSFEAFTHLLETVMSRLAAAGMTLKGSKCELLHPAMDLLGFVATPHGLMMQKPKLQQIMDSHIPRTPKAAMTFLGAVAFLRRMVPRISLLSAPMTDAIKRFNLRTAPPRPRDGKPPSQKPRGGEFNEEEQLLVDESWRAIVEHLDGDAVLAAPDFEDPLAHFVICTDASDYAVGGVLMQWQHEQLRGPGPPEGIGVDDPGKNHQGKPIDPLDSKWRAEAGWELKVISYYSKTLDDAQKNYPAFDKEAGAALVCCRHWADLITYHPTTLYTDSSVATSMLTKHIAPPRLQRWGAELGTFLPHLRISYRKGADNGLADLLSRFPVFNKYASVRTESVDLPDDYFEFVGDAPFYHRIPSSRRREIPQDAVYELYEPKSRVGQDNPFWVSANAPEIPGRGVTDRVRKAAPEEADPPITAAIVAAAERDVAQSKGARKLLGLLHELRVTVTELQERTAPTARPLALQTFTNTYDSPPVFRIDIDDHAQRSEVLEEVERLGGVCVVDSDEVPDVTITTTDSGNHGTETLELRRPDVMPAPTVSLAGSSYAIGGPLARDKDFHDCSVRSGHVPLSVVLDRVVARLLHERHRMPLPSNRNVPRTMREQWAFEGYEPKVYRLDVEKEPPRSNATSIFGVNGDNDDDAAVDADEPRTEQRRRTRPWQESSESDDDRPTAPPTVKVTLEEQLQDPRLRLVIDTLRGSRRATRSSRARLADKYELRDDGLHCLVLKGGEPGLALVVPQHLRSAILALYHYSLVDGGGHVGGQTMYDQIRSSYYWQDMERECHEFAAACERCGGTRSQGTIGAEQRSSPTPDAPFQVIHVDHKGPLPLMEGCTHVLVVVCALTKFTLYLPVQDTTALTTFRALRDRVFSIFGTPLVIVADNGSSFANKMMKASEKLYGYRWVHVMPHTPMANGLAEAAVKKLKMILDRHTEQYQGWSSIVGMAQTMVNQRTSSGSMENPFAALFGRQPITLTALENPSLLPTNSPEEKQMSELAFKMSRIHRRLQDEADSIKDLARENANQGSHASRAVRIGDKVWLTYSDSERARYLRKHGHGIAWRHPFKVIAVKPHAVMLDIPRDGSVPDVLPWQSLRKCAFAAPFFHRDDLPLPTTNDAATPVVDDVAAPAADNPNPTSADGNQPSDSSAQGAKTGGAPTSEWADWTSSKRYTIERILSAERLGSGWRLQVKWAGSDITTPERLHRVLQDINGEPELLRQIKQCQDEYDAAHPNTATQRRVEEAVATPARKLPSRERGAPRRFMFHVSEVTANPDETFISAGIHAIRDVLVTRCLALTSLASDFTNFATPIAHAVGAGAA